MKPNSDLQRAQKFDRLVVQRFISIGLCNVCVISTNRSLKTEGFTKDIGLPVSTNVVNLHAIPFNWLTINGELLNFRVIPIGRTHATVGLSEVISAAVTMAAVLDGAIINEVNEDDYSFFFNL